MGRPGHAWQHRPAFPKARVVTVSERASHAVVDAEIGGIAGRGAGETPGIGPLGVFVDGPGSGPGSILGPTGSKASSRATVGPGSHIRWWGYVDLNHGPLPYQGSALTG